MGIFDKMANQLLTTASGQAARFAGSSASSWINGQIGNLWGLSALNPATGVLQSQFKIDDFRTNLDAHGGLALSDKFAVMIVVPQIITQSMGVAIQELTLQCENAELPSRDINLIEYRHYGFIKRIPHMNQYGQASFTFIMTGDAWEKRLFDRWMDIMVPSNSGLVTYPLDGNLNPLYETVIQVNQYNATGQWIYQALLIDAVPTSVAPINLDWSADQPNKVQVTFAFRKWLSDSTDASVPPTDFGSAVGGKATINTTNPVHINNQTNDVPGSIPGFLNSPLGQTVTNDIKSAVQTSGALSPKIKI